MWKAWPKRPSRHDVRRLGGGGVDGAAGPPARNRKEII